jgi:hypothetical protein
VRNNGVAGHLDAVVIASGIIATGEREVLGLDAGDSEDSVFWRGFLKSVRQRVLGGVRPGAGSRVDPRAAVGESVAVGSFELRPAASGSGRGVVFPR